MTQYRFVFFTGLMLLLSTVLRAQVPIISAIDKPNTFAGDIITISGSGFGTDPAMVVVQFGAARGEIVELTNNIIIARVPAGALYSIISVTNLASDRTAFSAQAFGPSYQGEGNFTLANLDDPPTYLQSRPGLFDICICDFDLDGLNDIASANDGGANTFISLHRNTGFPTNASFTTEIFNIGIATKNIRCSDINGDGLPDIIISQGGTQGDRIFLYRNESSTGTLSFSLAQTLLVDGNNARIPLVHDLDADGRPEIVVTNESNNRISIFKNNSTGNDFGFSNAVTTLTMQNAGSSAGIGIEDLDNDNLPEIIINPNFESNLIIFKNNSSTGTLRFQELDPIILGQSLVQLRLADVDGDERTDVVVTRLLGNDFAVLLNQTTDDGPITFADRVLISTEQRPWGIDVGDIDGDGRVDVVIGSILAGTTTYDVYINSSSIGTASFDRFQVTSGARNRNMRIADVTGDSKPEIITTQVDDNRIAIFRNNNCLKPTITPGGPITQCIGTDVRLFTNPVDGLSYQWRLNGNPVAGSGPSIQVTQSGNYTVIASSEGGTCVVESEPVSVTFQAGSIPPNSTASTSGLTCVGDEIQLFASAVTGGNYIWSGPNGFSSTAQNPVIPNVSLEDVGYYFLEIGNGSCESLKDTTIVEVSSLPDLEIALDGETTFCTGGSASLEVPSLQGFAYQWLQNGSPLSGETGATFSATNTGNYQLQFTNGDDCASATSAVEIRAADIPVPAFSLPSSDFCVNEAFTITNTSTFDTDFTPVYSWTFGDGGTSAVQSPQYAYTSAAIRTINLRVSYEEVAGCEDDTSLPVTIAAAPVVEIATEDGTAFCQGKSIILNATPGLGTYLWNTGEETASIEVTEEDTYTVGVISDIGCEASASITTSFFPLTAITIMADPAVITEGDSLTVSAMGGVSYSWSPDSLFLNGTNLNAVAQARPPETTFLRVDALDANGCEASDSIQIIVEPGEVEQVVSPAKFFTPNGDGMDETWVIENIINLPECTVLVFNRAGLKVLEQTTYVNDWDGTFNGTPLREGAYYYVIQCGGKTISKGAVNLFR